MEYLRMESALMKEKVGDEAELCVKFFCITL